MLGMLRMFLIKGGERKGGSRGLNLGRLGRVG